MKVLQTARKNLAKMGFSPNQQQNTNRIVGRRQIIGICISTISTSLVGVYFLHVANSTEEYMYSFFSLTAGVGITVSYISISVKNDKIFDTIGFGERVMIESKLQF